MSEINGRKHADYAGYTPGPWNYVGGGDWTAGDDSQFLDLDESSMEGIANLCLIRAAADPLTGLAATLAKLAAMEQDRDDWERRAFAAGAECDHWRANHASVVDRRERRAIAIQERRA